MSRGVWIFIGLLVLAFALLALVQLAGLVMGPGFDP